MNTGAVVRLAEYYRDQGHDPVWALLLAQREVGRLERLGLRLVVEPPKLTPEQMMEIMRREYRKIGSVRS